MKIINRYKALSLPVKAALWFIVSNFLIKGISFLTVPLFTYYLSAEEYGKVGIYLTYQDMLINFATMELYSGAYIRGLLRYKDNVSFFTWSEQFLSSIITILVFILSLPAMRFLISNAQINLGIYLLMYSYFMFFPAYQCWVGRKRFEYQYKPVILLAVIYTIISVIIPLFAVIKIEATASARLTFMLIPEVMFCLPFYLKNIHLKRLFARKNEVYEQCKFLISFQAPAVIHAFSYILLSSVDRIMIGKMVGNAETGIYTVATTIASAITILCISANQVLKPWRYQSMEKNEHSTIKSTSNLLLFAFGLGISLWILIAPDLMHILFSAEYHEAIWVIPPVSMSVFFVFLYSMFVDIEEYFYKTKYTMYATTISAVANVILNYVGIRLCGYIACAYTTLICYMLLAALHLYWSNKAAKKNSLAIGRIFDVKFIVILSVGLVIAEILFTFSYQMSIVRYTLFVLGVIILILNYKRIHSLIKTVRSN
ncbi:MAG: oligosaccharide flippase family protein [Ruminococcus sp.]|nr:oligosaccharide flippase family protein [Ruminococcus sp.]MBR3668325.1 oligosaccharide flippase family protein [Ruminococcus sp.]